MLNPQAAIRNPSCPLPSPGASSLLWRWWLAAFLVSLLLYAPALNAFFIVDDLSTLAHVAPQAGHSWWSVLTPETNGSLRMTREISIRTLIALFGLRPLPFHLLGLALHSLVAALAGLLALRLPGGRPATGWLAALLLAAHIGACSSAMMLGNFCDVYLALGLLAGLLGWRAWLADGRSRSLALALGGFAFAALSKETAMVVPAMVLPLTLAAGFDFRRAWRPGAWDASQPSVPPARRIWLVQGGLWLAAAAFAAKVAWCQTHNTISYVGLGTYSHSPVNFLRQLADYSTSTLVPYLHLLEWPVPLPPLSNGVLWAVRALVLAVLGLMGLRFLRRPRGQWTACLLLAAVMPLLPVSTLAGKPQGRYIYAALSLVCIALARPLAAWRGWRRAALGTALGVLWLAFVAGFYVSPTLRDYRQSCRQVAAFVDASRRAAPAWGRGATIAIFNHPHPSPAGWQWVYGQLLFNLFLPEARATLALDAITSQTSHAYRFENGGLVELPLGAKVKGK